MTTRTTWSQRPLTDWWFAPVPDGSDWRSLPDEAWQRVEVPHRAESDLADVRRGGRVAYRTSVRLEPQADTHQLRFEAVGYRCRVEAGERLLAEHEGAWDPFVVDLPAPADPAGDTVEIAVVADLADYEPDSPLHFRSLLLGFVPDTAGPFGGLWRPVTYRARSGRWLAGLRLVTEQDGPAVRADWRPASGDARVDVTVEHADGAAMVTGSAPADAGTVTLPCPDATSWRPDRPALYTVRIRLVGADGAVCDEEVRRVGFRRVVADGRRIRLNGTPVYLRGVLHWGHYPDLGTPSADPDRTRAELELIRSLGFNAVKVCLFLAPEHFYDLCDELGLLVWQEFPLWLPRDDAYLEPRVRAQYPRLMDMVAGHPSVVLVSLGCELESTVPTGLLDWAYEQARRQMPHALVCANSGSGECFGGGREAASDIYDYHFYADPHQLDELTGAFTGGDRPPRPWLFGEYNDADTWRTVAGDGSGERTPAWLSADPAVNPLRSVHAGFASDQQVYRQAEIIAEQGYTAELPGLRELSHRQARDTRKLVWELTRSRPDISGYVTTVLRDVAPTSSGLLDDEGKLKFDAADLRRSNADAVLAVRSPRRRVWFRGGDRLRVLDPHNAVDGGPHAFAVRLANATAAAGPAELVVRLDAGSTVLAVERRTVEVPAHTVRELADIVWTPTRTGADHTVHARLSVTVRMGDRVLAGNDWPVLVHPSHAADREGHGRLFVHDPGGLLDGLADAIGARPVRDEAELVAVLTGAGPATVGGRLVTAAYGSRTRTLTAEYGLRTFVVGDGRYFPVRPGPFWRENVMRIQPGTWLAGTLPPEQAGVPAHAGIPLGAVAGDGYFPRDEIRRRVGPYTPLLTRYDARTYAVGEHVFEWREGAGRTAVSTLRFAGGTGTQPRAVADNPLALALITAFLRSDD